MHYYHGTTKKGLIELIPFSSTHSNMKDSLVYLTTNKQLALHYIWDLNRCPVKMPMLNIRKDGVLIFQEMFSGALEYFYKGLSGYIYHCVGDYETSGNAGVMSCITVKRTVPICDCEFIEDVYERIMEYQKKGTFIYERYEDLPEWRRDIIRGHVIRAIKRNKMLVNQSNPLSKFYQDKFSKYWKEAEVLAKNGLL